MTEKDIQTFYLPLSGVMIILKPLISVLLILTYTIGFGFGLTPSCEGECSSEIKLKHHHNHHVHTDGEEDIHISHGDHFDENLVDLFLCLISDVESHQEGCNRPHSIQNVYPRDISSEVTFSKVFDIHNDGSLDELSVSINDFELQKNYKPIRFWRFHYYLGTSCLRGPPISC